VQIGRLCEALGQYCAATAMIFAMHQIQVACMVHLAQSSTWFRDYLSRLVEEQRLIPFPVAGAEGTAKLPVLRRG
jgi:acyl-CoA dehydrogenase